MMQNGRRKTVRMLLAAVMVGLSSGPLLASVFEEANQAYIQGDYARSAALYSQLAEDHPDSPVYAYNLGNARVRLDQPAKAILAYERARLAAPRERDILENLRFVRSGLEYKIEDRRSWYIRAGEKILQYVTEQEVWLLLGTACFLFLAGVLLPLLLRRDRLWGPVQKLFAVLLACAAVLAAGKSVEMWIYRDAVVMVDDAQVRYGPSRADRVALSLGRGLKVYVIDHRDGWKRVALVNGEGGWILDDEIREVAVRTRKERL